MFGRKLFIAGSLIFASLVLKADDLYDSFSYYSARWIQAVKAGDQPQKALSEFKMGVLYQQNKEFEEAIEFFDKSAETYRNLDDKKSQALSLYNKALGLMKLEKYQQAIHVLNECVDLHQNNGQSGELAKVYNTLSNSWLYSGNYINAVEYSYLALKTAIQDEIDEVSGQIYSQLADIYSGTDAKASPDYQRIYHTIRDSLLNEQSRKRLASLMAKSNIIDTQQKNLREEIYLNQIHLKRQQIFIILLSCMALAIIVLAYILHRRYRANHKTNTLLEQNHEKLLVANAELAELNATKNKYFEVISQSLKNPFNSILENSESLYSEFDMLSKEQKMELLDKIRCAGKNTYHFFENLLEWSKIQSGDYEFNPEAIEIVTVVKNELEALNVPCFSRNIQVTSDIASGSSVFADKRMTSLIIRNLLSNALTFTPENGHITITSSYVNNHLELAVKDTGIGISKENLKKLFRLDEAMIKPSKGLSAGSGLGLILAYSYASINKGELWAESEPGKGSVFTLALPLAT
jgi:signal transduction histidine kinase